MTATRTKGEDESGAGGGRSSDDARKRVSQLVSISNSQFDLRTLTA